MSQLESAVNKVSMVQTSGDCIAAHQWYPTYVRFDSDQTSYVNMKVHLFKTYLEIMTKKVDISLTISPIVPYVNSKVGAL